MTFALCLLAALVVGTLVEYTLHRALHSGRLRRTSLGRLHLAHHRSNRANPFLTEWLDYSLVALSLAWVAPLLWWLLDWPEAVTWLAGGIGYAALVAWSHCRQHRHTAGRHWLHHEYPTTNYGIVCGFWDWVLGTRAPVPRDGRILLQLFDEDLHQGRPQT